MEISAFKQHGQLMDYIFNLWKSGEISKIHMQDIYKDQYESFVNEPMPIGLSDVFYDRGLEELELIGG